MHTDIDSWYRWDGSDLLLNVLVQPRASCDVLVGIHGRFLKVKIKATPVDGKANHYLIKFLAKTFNVPNSQVSLISGNSSRHKRFRITLPRHLPGLFPQEN